MNEKPDTNGARVAVIAIHGVGDHLPEEMAKAACGLLESRQDAAGGSRYGVFREDLVRIKVAGVKTSPDHALHAPRGKRAWGPLDALRLSGRPAKPAAAAQKDSIDHVFMEGQLTGYESQGPEDIYEFLRLQGVRKADPDAPEKRVDVYDMFWSDLSGVGTSGLRILGELYQILFHLGSVGVNNVAAAAAFFRGKAGIAEKWDAFSKAQKFAAGTLAFPIPLFNLIILTFAAALFVTSVLAKSTPAEQGIVASIVVITLIAAGWGYSLSRAGKFSAASFRAPLILALVGSSLAAAAIAILKQRWVNRPPGSQEFAQAIIAALIWGAAVYAAFQIASAYDKLRPGAQSAFWWTLWAVIACTAGSLFSHPWVGHYFAMAILIRGAEVGFWLLAISWCVFWGGMLWAFVSGRNAAKAVQGILGESDRASRTNWTARLTIGLTATVFLLVSFAAWAGLLHAELPLLPRDASLAPHQALGDDHKLHWHPTESESESHCAKLLDTVCYSPLYGRGEGVQPARTWADQAFYDAGLGFIPVLLLFTGIAALIALQAIAPSAADEIAPPSGADPHAAMALGNWLNQGFGFMRWAGRVLYAGVFLFPLAMAFGLIAIRLYPKWMEGYVSETAPFAEILGALVGGAAVGVLAFGGRLSNLALGLRTGVRVALDVDNWLREHPRGTNPTAKICARYVSLLRYIAQWRNENGEGYDALVIFAHSQGTVITADLLRFLHVEARAAGGFAHYDSSLEGLAKMKINLFTMGCPLRQLYGLRFPYIYGFAFKSVTGRIPPEPWDLGLTRWTNAYRTGDYVGRHLWRSDNHFAPAEAVSPAGWAPADKVPENVFVDGPRTEFAIGPGAHTHYWDRTGDQIAETLDAMIVRA